MSCRDGMRLFRTKKWLSPHASLSPPSFQKSIVETRSMP